MTFVFFAFLHHINVWLEKKLKNLFVKQTKLTVNLLLLIGMDSDTRENWEKIKAHFETLPEFKRDNQFYRRAVEICGNKPDPLVEIDFPITGTEAA